MYAKTGRQNLQLCTSYRFQIVNSKIQKPTKLNHGINFMTWTIIPYWEVAYCPPSRPFNTSFVFISPSLIGFLIIFGEESAFPTFVGRAHHVLCKRCLLFQRFVLACGENNDGLMDWSSFVIKFNELSEISNLTKNLRKLEDLFCISFFHSENAFWAFFTFHLSVLWSLFCIY